TIWVEQEPGSSGIDSFQYLAKKLAGFKVRPDRVTGPKEVRAEPWASQCAAGNVYLVEDGTWDVPGWIAEHCQFPLGKLADRVDSAWGGCGKLVTAPPRGSSRILRSGGPRSHRPSLRIVVCSREQLAGVVIEQGSFLVVVPAPPPEGKPDLPP